MLVNGVFSFVAVLIGFNFLNFCTVDYLLLLTEFDFKFFGTVGTPSIPCMGSWLVPGCFSQRRNRLSFFRIGMQKDFQSNRNIYTLKFLIYM